MKTAAQISVQVQAKLSDQLRKKKTFFKFLRLKLNRDEPLGMGSVISKGLSLLTKVQSQALVLHPQLRD